MFFHQRLVSTKFFAGCRFGYNFVLAASLLGLRSRAIFLLTLLEHHEVIQRVEDVGLGLGGRASVDVKALFLGLARVHREFAYIVVVAMGLEPIVRTAMK